ncbi:MAG: HAMP domain-containing histidine kinase [Myxococcales bacterium]|nr:MAG: HAMP domain-containing histidine kinase [Myxococcales bacterium]
MERNALMEARPQSSYLKLAQFLDLESRWLGAPDKVELCHRICRTVVLLLDTSATAIGLVRRQTPYRLVASAGDWPQDPIATAAAAGSLVRRACETGTPQLKSTGDDALGVFPFRVDDELRGCLHVRVDRPIFHGDEVACLRFVTSLSGIVLAGGAPAADESLDAEQPVDSPEDAARRRVAMAVHDLRNPLAVLSGYVELLADGGRGELNDQQTAAAESMSRQVAVLGAAIEKLMELDRATTAETVAATTFELRELFEEIARTRFPHASDRITWPGPEAVFEFDTDRDRVISIVQNLVDNALRHGGDGRVVVDCARRRRQLLISVSDEGAGLPPELRSVFEISSPIPGSPSSGPASGLGLLAVAGHVRVLGGKVEVSTSAGGGAAISVQIPARRAAQGAEHRA